MPLHLTRLIRFGGPITRGCEREGANAISEISWKCPRPPIQDLILVAYEIRRGRFAWTGRTLSAHSSLVFNTTNDTMPTAPRSRSRAACVHHVAAL